MKHLITSCMVVAMGLTGCIAVPVRDVTYLPGFIQFGPDQTVLIDVAKETSWRWFVAMIIPEKASAGGRHTFWSEPTIQQRYIGTKVVNLSRGTCRMSTRTRPGRRQIERLFRQVNLPTAAEQRPITTGAAPSYQLQVVRHGQRAALRVVGPTGARTIPLGEIEHKVYWIVGTDLAHTVGHLISLSSGAVYKHSARYLRAFIRDKRIFVIIPAHPQGQWQGELLELSYPELKRVRSIYRGNRMVAVDYDGARVLFASPTAVQVFDLRSNRWVKASHKNCVR